MRVGVIGAGGAMGAEVCRAVDGVDGMELVAAVDPRFAGVPLGDVVGGGRATGAGALVVGSDVTTLLAAGAEVAVDFTRRDAALTSLEHCAAAGVHAVVGTTGFTEEDLSDIRRWFAGPAAGTPNCVLAANFAIGAVLMMRFAALAAPWFDGVEIVERHRGEKEDAPSGTAVQTAALVSAARRDRGAAPFPPDATVTWAVEGARGGPGPGGVRLHSVRLPGSVAHQEVLFGSRGQTLTIRHDALDRVAFMDGVLLAIGSVAGRPGLTVGIDTLLGLDP
ncbi:MAG: 4-hydroxy-tetrahydrodipicolinate reductase [Actinomycetota bacterium]|nr:4-hydroxy-tetrahydrodipicolinate reductase [Actinomycetota bacterium]MDA8341690.1 4-hydroxy-tetrahydrodipicolinate reductase [Actinomycetota bacterium]